MRKQRISLLLQQDREQQFPRYYLSQGKFEQYQSISGLKNIHKYKQLEPEHLKSKEKSEEYFSSKALKKPSATNIARRQYFDNQSSLENEIIKNYKLEQLEIKKKQSSKYIPPSLIAKRNYEKMQAEAARISAMNQKQTELEVVEEDPGAQQDGERPDNWFIESGMSMDDYQKVLYRRFGKKPKRNNPYSFNTIDEEVPDSRKLETHQSQLDQDEILDKDGVQEVDKGQDVKLPAQKDRTRQENQQHHHSALDNLQDKLKSLNQKRYFGLKAADYQTESTNQKASDEYGTKEKQTRYLSTNLAQNDSNMDLSLHDSSSQGNSQNKISFTSEPSQRQRNKGKDDSKV